IIQHYGKATVDSIRSATLVLASAALLISACSAGDVPIGGATSALDEPIAIAECTQITSPGSYVLTADLIGSAGTCLAIRNTSQVTLDCQNHAIVTGWQAILVENTSDATIRNCRIEPPPAWAGLNVIVEIENSPNGVFAGNTLGNAALTRDATLYMTVGA